MSGGNRLPGRYQTLDLFAGCEGLTLGLKRARFQVVNAIEIDSVAAVTYGHNHPEVHLWTKDIRTVTTVAIKRKLRLHAGALHLLAACPPCQGFSSIRTLNGGTAVRDARNDLLLEVLRFVNDLKPMAVMLENVPGLADDDRMLTFESGLARLGYIVQWDILNTADYAIPQRRRRLIILASRLGKIPFAPRARIKMTVRDAIAGLPKPTKSADLLHSHGEQRTARILRRIKRIPKDGGSRGDLGTRSQLPCHRACDGFHDVYGRMAWNDLAPTITGGCINPSKGRFLHPNQDRAVTLREAALLQTFPPGYKFSMQRGKYHVAEQIGNALPPEFIERHSRQIYRHLQRYGVEVA